MTDRPILFSAPMVRAILDGRKTVTRRLVKDAGGAFWDWDHAGYRPTVVDGRVRWHCDAGPGAPMPRSPYGGPGDRLWVRETVRRCPTAPAGDGWPVAVFAADDAPTVIDTWPWQRDVLPSIHMPRGVSRITLDVVSVRVERLHEITEEDARDEGVDCTDGMHDDADLCRMAKSMGAMATDSRVWFACLWDSLNAERAPWDSNPWVWRVEFRQEVTP